MITFCPQSVVWGDVATWIAAMGTLVAVGAAVWTASEAHKIAREPVERARRDRKTQAILLAWLLQPEIAFSRSAARTLVHERDEQFRRKAAANPTGEEARLMVAGVRNAGLTIAQQRIFDLALLPGEAAKRLATVIGHVDVMRRYIEDSVRSAREEDRLEAYNRATATAAEVLPQLERVLALLTPLANSEIPTDSEGV